MGRVGFCLLVLGLVACGPRTNGDRDVGDGAAGGGIAVDSSVGGTGGAGAEAGIDDPADGAAPPGATCPLLPTAPGATGPVVQLSTPCGARQAQACSRAGATGRVALDSALTELFVSCGAECWEGGMLTVTFEQGCAQSFVLSQFLPPGTIQGWMDLSTDPALTACIQQRLEAVNFDCAGDYHCAIGLVEGVPVMCGAP